MRLEFATLGNANPMHLKGTRTASSTGAANGALSQAAPPLQEATDYAVSTAATNGVHERGGG